MVHYLWWLMIVIVTQRCQMFLATWHPKFKVTGNLALSTCIVEKRVKITFDGCCKACTTIDSLFHQGVKTC